MAYLARLPTTSLPGTTTLATNAEAVAASITNKMLVPSNLTSIFASPPVIGNTGANSATFTSLTLNSPLTGANGGTGVNNGTKTINLGSPTSGYVLTSDSSGNATWQVNAALGGVTSLSGTANQINMSASTGAVTASLSSTIVTPGTLAVNGSLLSGSATTLNSTNSYNTVTQGTQTTATGGTFSQAGHLIQSIFSPANNANITAGSLNVSRFIAASGKTLSLSSAYYSSINSSGNIGILTVLSSYYSDTFVAVGGTASKVYGFYGKNPNTGTIAQAAYFDNLSIGYDSIDLKGTNNVIMSGNVSIGSSTLTSLFNVGNSNQFQINASGVITNGIWNGTQVSEIYGGTNQISYTLGDTLYASAANTLSKLSGNTTTAKQYLSQTGTGSASAAPVWATISGADITGAALTKTDDTNVTITLGGSPTTSLLRATSLTLGWTGTLAETRGGTNQSSYTTGDLLQASATNTLSKLAAVATGNALISGGIGTVSSWGKIGLTTHVSGVLPYANGGTNANTTWTQGSVLFAGASSFAQDNSNLFWDSTNHKLGIGTNSIASNSVLDILRATDSGNPMMNFTGLSSNTTQFWNAAQINIKNTSTAVNTFTGVSFSNGNGLAVAYLGAQVMNASGSVGSGDLYFGTVSGGSIAERMRIPAAGSVVVGNGSISTSATDGFLYIATGNGAPSGVPTSFTGRVPMYYDTSGNKFYIYNGGWKSVTLT